MFFDKEDDAEHDFVDILLVLGALGTLAISATASGLYSGLLALEPTHLYVLEETGSDAERRYAARLLKLLKYTHVLGLSLVLIESLASEALPIALEKLFGNEYASIVASVPLTLFFGDLLPSIVFSGPRVLPLMYHLTPFLYFTVATMAVVSVPLSAAAARIPWLAEEQGLRRYGRHQLRSFLRLHRISHPVHNEQHARSDSIVSTLSNAGQSVVRAIRSMTASIHSRSPSPSIDGNCLPVLLCISDNSVEEPLLSSEGTNDKLVEEIHQEQSDVQLVVASDMNVSNFSSTNPSNDSILPSIVQPSSPPAKDSFVYLPQTTSVLSTENNTTNTTTNAPAQPDIHNIVPPPKPLSPSSTVNLSSINPLKTTTTSLWTASRREQQSSLRRGNSRRRAQLPTAWRQPSSIAPSVLAVLHAETDSPASEGTPRSVDGGGGNTMLTERELSILEGTLELSSLHVGERMRKLCETVFVRDDEIINAPFLQRVANCVHSRLPVLCAETGRPKGVLLVKALLHIAAAQLLFQTEPQAVGVDSQAPPVVRVRDVPLITPILLHPEWTLLRALRAFQRSGASHLAFVTRQITAAMSTLQHGERVPGDVVIEGVFTLNDLLLVVLGANSTSTTIMKIPNSNLNSIGASNKDAISTATLSVSGNATTASAATEVVPNLSDASEMQSFMKQLSVRGGPLAAAAAAVAAAATLEKEHAQNEV